MANVWPATQSQLYSELNKLADNGFIEVSAVGARGRKEYRITDAGHAELQRWVTNPQDDPPFRSAALLRIFLLNLIPAGQARVHLATMAEYSDAEVARLSELRGSADWNDSGEIPDHDFFALAALDYGQRLNAMRADWARDVIAKLESRPY